MCQYLLLLIPPQCSCANVYAIFSIHISERYLWKRAPAALKLDPNSELSGLWAVGQCLLLCDVPGAIAAMLERGAAAWDLLGSELVDTLVQRLREQQWSNILTSYDTISLSSAAVLTHLSSVDCKQGIDLGMCLYSVIKYTMFYHFLSVSFHSIRKYVPSLVLTPCM